MRVNCYKCNSFQRLLWWDTVWKMPDTHVSVWLSMVPARCSSPFFTPGLHLFFARCLYLYFLFLSWCWTRMYKEFCDAPHRHQSGSVPWPRLLLSHWLQRTLFRILMSLLNWRADSDISLSVSHGTQTETEREPFRLHQDAQNKGEVLFSLPYRINPPTFPLPILLTFVSDWEKSQVTPLRRFVTRFHFLLSGLFSDVFSEENVARLWSLL